MRNTPKRVSNLDHIVKLPQEVADILKRRKQTQKQIRKINRALPVYLESNLKHLKKMIDEVGAWSYSKRQSINLLVITEVYR